MEHEGPQLEALTHRLSECPAEFLSRPIGLPDGKVNVAAIVCDHLRAMGAMPDAAAVHARLTPARKPASRAADENRLQLVAIATWLLHDQWFLGRQDLAPAMTWLLVTGLDSMAQVVSAPAAVRDPDRREELVRHCLAQLGLRPRGETEAQALDRLRTLDSVERERVIHATRAAEERACQIREAMARKAAAEAAARYSPE